MTRITGLSFFIFFSSCARTRDTGGGHDREAKEQ